MKPNWTLRLLLNLSLLYAILFLPHVVSVVVILALLIFWHAPEVLVWGLGMDILYGVETSLLGEIPLFFTLVSLFLFVVVGLVKQQLIFYHAS